MERNTRTAKEHSKRTGYENRIEQKPQPGGSLHFGLKMNQQDCQKADHNGSTDVSTTPLPEALDTNHHVSHVCIPNWHPIGIWKHESYYVVQ